MTPICNHYNVSKLFYVTNNPKYCIFLGNCAGPYEMIMVVHLVTAFCCNIVVDSLFTMLRDIEILTLLVTSLHYFIWCM
jgi:hypothetical protein